MSERDEPAPNDEMARRRAVSDTGLVDGTRVADLDLLARTAANLGGARMAAITLITDDEQRVVAGFGLEPFVVERSAAFCNLTIHRPDGVLVTNALTDERFSDSSLVTGAPHLRSYVGVPVHSGGQAVGALCLLSTGVGSFDLTHLELVRDLARLVDRTLEVRWRRQLATPPPIEEVEELARSLGAGASFGTLDELNRPALVFERSSLEIVHVNAAAVDCYAWSSDEFTALTVLDLRPPDEAQVLAAGIREGAASEVQPYWNDRKTVHWDATKSPFPVALRLADFELDGRELRLAVITDLTSHEALSAAVLHAASFDPLTELGNRRYLTEQLAAACARPGRTALLFVDLDHFKSVNDVAGHRRGDELLVAAAARISLAVPVGAIVTRYSADEFVVVVPNEHVGQIAELADEIRRAIAEPFRLGVGEFHLTASVGLAIGDSLLGPDELLGRADDAVAEAKRLGRNRVVEASSVTRAAHQRRSQLEHDVVRAIDRGEFELWYQPIVPLAPDAPAELYAAEALIRWRHPVQGIVAPGEFLPVVFEIGLGARLTELVIDEAAAAIATMRAAGRATRLTVNCSPDQLTRSLIGLVDAAVERHGIRHRDLRIEVTESAVFADYGEAQFVIEELANHDVITVIDDFGSGYSTLGRLSTLPVQGLKLDAHFIRATDTEAGRRMLMAVVDLGHAAGLPMALEGIETAEHLATALDCGVEFGQGYVIARPAPLDQLAARVVIDRNDPPTVRPED